MAAQAHAKLSGLASGLTGRITPPRPFQSPSRPDTSYRNDHLFAGGARFSMHHANINDLIDGTVHPHFRTSMPPPKTSATSRSRTSPSKMRQQSARMFSASVGYGRMVQMARKLNHVAHTERQGAVAAWQHAQAAGQQVHQFGQTAYREFREEYNAERARQREQKGTVHDQPHPNGQGDSGHRPGPNVAPARKGPSAVHPNAVDMAVARPKEEWEAIVGKWHQQGMSKDELLDLSRHFRNIRGKQTISPTDFEKKYASRINGSVTGNQNETDDGGVMTANYKHMSTAILAAIRTGKVV